MAEMRHPHIVQFLGLCFLERSALPVLVMERLDSSLDDLLETSPGLPLALKQSLLTDVARGLLYLHTRNPPPLLFLSSSSPSSPLPLFLLSPSLPSFPPPLPLLFLFLLLLSSPSLSFFFCSFRHRLIHLFLPPWCDYFQLQCMGVEPGCVRSLKNSDWNKKEGEMRKK